MTVLLTPSVPPGCPLDMVHRLSHSSWGLAVSLPALQLHFSAHPYRMHTDGPASLNCFQILESAFPEVIPPAWNTLCSLLSPPSASCSPNIYSSMFWFDQFLPGGLSWLWIRRCSSQEPPLHPAPPIMALPMFYLSSLPTPIPHCYIQKKQKADIQKVLRNNLNLLWSCLENAKGAFVPNIQQDF